MSAPFVPALFRVGVFAVVGRIQDEKMHILVNVRTDQEKQRKAAGLPDDWEGKIVDLLGGTFQAHDLSFEDCLKREAGEETVGCQINLIGGIKGPFPMIKPETGTAEKPHDLAFVAVAELLGEPKPNAEASEHRWVTWEQLQSEQEVRFPGKLGKTGRMAQMTHLALETFKAEATFG